MARKPDIYGGFSRASIQSAMSRSRAGRATVGDVNRLRQFSDRLQGMAARRGLGAVPNPAKGLTQKQIAAMSPQERQALARGLAERAADLRASVSGRKRPRRPSAPSAPSPIYAAAQRRQQRRQKKQTAAGMTDDFDAFVAANPALPTEEQLDSVEERRRQALRDMFGGKVSWQDALEAMDAWNAILEAFPELSAPMDEERYRALREFFNTIIRPGRKKDEYLKLLSQYIAENLQDATPPDYGGEEEEDW